MKIEINLVEVLGADLLAGRALGSRHLAVLMDRISRSFDECQASGADDVEKALFVLDFARIRVATSSYLAAAILPLWNWEAALRSNAYPVLANLGHGVQDEIEFVLKARCAAAWVGYYVAGQLQDVSLMGTLDESLSGTLKRFSPLVELSATDLASPGEQIGATAWNNRLTALHELRLLHRRRLGRRQVYSLPWSEVPRG